MPLPGAIPIAESRESVHGYVQDWRGRGGRIALVPTMGNLHQGHLALIDRAREIADRVIASIYVNPTQFGPGEDFENYPRTLEHDLRALTEHGADLAFTPRTADLYPWGLDHYTAVKPPAVLADTLCGARRPGHFDGVLSVVIRLFNMVQPDTALFGEKDYQQLVIIRRMVADLALPLAIEAVATAREPSGLAMSSRNAYLNADERERAAALYRTLRRVAARLVAGVNDHDELEAGGMEALRGAGLEPEYVAIRRAHDLCRPASGDRDLRVLAAARCGVARLIDNIGVSLQSYPTLNRAGLASNIGRAAAAARPGSAPSALARIPIARAQPGRQRRGSTGRHHRRQRERGGHRRARTGDTPTPLARLRPCARTGCEELCPCHGVSDRTRSSFSAMIKAEGCIHRHLW